MIDIQHERNITNALMLEYLDLWKEFDITSVDDKATRKYYNELMDLISSQLDESIRWINSNEAKEYFISEAKYHENIFNKLETSWDNILNRSYDNVDELLDAIYDKGKELGYKDMREHIHYTKTDKLALQFVKDYNFNLIQRIDDDVRNEIKNKIITGILSGENPNNITPKILNIAEEKLTDSIFTPRQRAVMIAKTEVSRAQNTGMLQSYVNEGYTEVKILTAEDNNVCYTCLTYAYEFNKESEVTYENRGEEKVHNISKLIKGGLYPPFHPLCRCTYISVWETKGEPSDNPMVVNLIPKKINEKITEFKDKLNRNEKYKNLKTPEETAEFFDLEFYDDDKKMFKFYDRDNDFTIFISKTATKGKNALISMNNSGELRYDLKKLIKTYYDAPAIMKKNNKSLTFLNRKGPGKGATLGKNRRYLNPEYEYYGDNFIDIYLKSGFDENTDFLHNLGGSDNIYRTMLHEMGHGVDLNDKTGLHLSTDKKYIEAFKKDGPTLSSTYALESYIDTNSLEEDVAEAISMVSYKNVKDKSSALIHVTYPIYDKKGNLINIEQKTLNYDEWCKKFPNRVKVIKKALGI